jgi:hypothetical protein
MPDIKNEKKLLACIGIGVFLTLPVFFFDIIMFGISGLSYLIIFFGLIIVSGLSLYYFRLNYAPENVIFPVTVAIIGAIVILVVVIFVGNALIHDMPAPFTYTVSINGLDQYNGLASEIRVPMPMINGEQVFSDDELQCRQFGQWTSIPVVTPLGKMIAFQTPDQNLTDIHAQWFRQTKGEKHTIDISSPLLSPKINPASGNSGLASGNGGSDAGYTSVIYLENVIKPPEENNGTISVDLSLFVSEGSYLGFFGNTYRARVSEEVVPVNAQVIPVQVFIERVTG